MKRIAMMLGVTLLLAGCADNAFKIEGHIADAGGQMLYLEQQSVDGVKVIDSVRIKDNGAFKLKYLRPEYPELYRLHLGNENLVVAIDSTERVKIEADAKNFATGFTVENSLATAHIRDLRASSFALQNETDSAMMGQIDAALAAHQQLAKNIIMENPRSLAAYYAIYQTINGYYFLSPYDVNDLPFWSAVATQFQHYYPEYERTAHLKAITLDAIRAKRAQQGITPEEIVVEETGMIEIELPNRVGDRVKLSSLAGKVVVIDFSAYAMEQASAHILFLRELYSKYQGRGLEIYQVSVDPNKLLWLEQSRNVPWITVRDEQGTNSRYLYSYNVEQLPTFFVMDREGNILGRSDYDHLESFILENL